MEVQAHGNDFEDRLIRNIAGVSKKEYEKMIPNGYTSALDIHKGTLSDFNGSVKVTGSKGIGCGDIVRFMTEAATTSFKLIVARWTQENKTTKRFTEVLEFDFTPEDYSKVFGTVDVSVIKEFVDYVKSIPAGKEAQQANKTVWKERRDAIKHDNNIGLISIDAKIDSKNQRRVQTALNIDALVESGVKFTRHTKNYRGIELNYTVTSGARTFDK